MSVHGIKSEGATGVWTVKVNTGRIATDEKNKPLVGLSFGYAASAAKRFYERTGQWASPVRP